MSRRHFLKHVAGCSLMALPAVQFLRTIQANAQEMRRNNKSLIILWMGGGPATIDIWDLKPGRPTGGEFRPIDTNVPGIQISQHMPRTAQQMSHLAIIRSLTTTEGDHNRGRQLMHTAYTPNPAMQYPAIGSVVAMEAPRLPNYQPGSLPAYIAVGGAAEGPGFLGMSYAPFTVQNPGTPPDNIRAPQGMGGTAMEQEDRIQRRRRMFHALEDNFMHARAPHLDLTNRNRFADASRSHSDVYNKGFSLVASSEGRVFELSGESAQTRDAYGAGQSGFGRGCLLARRLVEAGVSAVEVDLGGWDTHQQNFNALRTRLLPQMDQSMAALVADLVQRGRWENTVLLWMGEFGRTPRINQNAGRDHWARSWSVVVGGGAIRGGQVHGSTDADGTNVANNPVRVGDLFATVYRALGIDPTTQVRDPIGRPFSISGENGRPIQALFA
jgi:hypothetical protein